MSNRPWLLYITTLITVLTWSNIKKDGQFSICHRIPITWWILLENSLRWRILSNNKKRTRIQINYLEFHKCLATIFLCWTSERWKLWFLSYSLWNCAIWNRIQQKNDCLRLKIWLREIDLNFVSLDSLFFFYSEASVFAAIVYPMVKKIYIR